MINNPKISVVIPVYGVERYLQQCIDSLINQSMTEIEYIFVNDASPDGCLDILLDNQAKHPDVIKVIDSPVNKKQGGARNMGVDASRAEFIGFVDSDDFVSPNMYRKLYDAINRTNSDASFIQYASVNSDTVYSYDKAGGGYQSLIGI